MRERVKETIFVTMFKTAKIIEWYAYRLIGVPPKVIRCYEEHNEDLGVYIEKILKKHRQRGNGYYKAEVLKW